MLSAAVLLVGIDVRINARHCAPEAQLKYRAARETALAVDEQLDVTGGGASDEPLEDEHSALVR
jgi:hypothetical protein